MYKDFDKWNEKKKLLDKKDINFFFKESEVWWCSVGINVAVESCGKGNTFRRPILILKKLSNDAFIGIPLSTQSKFGSWFTFVSILGLKRCALLYQVRMVSANRLQRRVTALDSEDFALVKQKLEKLLELCNYH